MPRCSGLSKGYDDNIKMPARISSTPVARACAAKNKERASPVGESIKTDLNSSSHRANPGARKDIKSRRSAVHANRSRAGAQGTQRSREPVARGEGAASRAEDSRTSGLLRVVIRSGCAMSSRAEISAIRNGLA